MLLFSGCSAQTLPHLDHLLHIRTLALGARHRLHDMVSGSTRPRRCALVRSPHSGWPAACVCTDRDRNNYPYEYRYRYRYSTVIIPRRLVKLVTPVKLTDRQSLQAASALRTDFGRPVCAAATLQRWVARRASRPMPRQRWRQRRRRPLSHRWHWLNCRSPILHRCRTNTSPTAQRQDCCRPRRSESAGSAALRRNVSPSAQQVTCYAMP